MLKKNLIIILCLFSINCYSQSYFELLRQGEKKLLKSDFEGALNDYEKAFNKFETPFIKDVVTAACMAHYANETYRLFIKVWDD